MNHELWRERLSLRHYDELDPHETAELEAHLAWCDACRGFAAELRAGLGRLQSVPASPADHERWLDDLRTSVFEHLHRSNAGPSRAFYLGVAAGLAAGILVASVASGWRNSSTTASPDKATFARASPPPLARAGGELAQLGRYLQR